MNSRKKRLKKALLYVILDKRAAGRRELPGLARRIARSGADIIQYRDKISSHEEIIEESTRLRRAIEGTGALFIINDYPEIAKVSEADGVHLGQSDTPLESARVILGAQKIIGISTHNLKEAGKAQSQGADYIGYGPLLATVTKPECRPVGLGSLKQLQREISIPVFVIGNMNRVTVKQVAAVGIKRIAVCRAVLRSKNVERAVRFLKDRLVLCT